jgi:DnaJ-class molecular chaperone
VSDAAQQIVAASRGVCRTCDGAGWSFITAEDAATNAKTPCPTCKPYGMRADAVSIHAVGSRVTHKWNDKTGIVLRSWRQSQGAKRPNRYVMCDVKYDNDSFGVAWEQDLVPYTVPDDAVPFDPDEE